LIPSIKILQILINNQKIKIEIERDLQLANDYFLFNEKFVDKEDSFHKSLEIELINTAYKAFATRQASF
jgi:hypothetical protein